MRTQLRPFFPRSLKQSGAYALVACGLALTLALGGCGAGARNGSGVATQQTTSGTTNGATTGGGSNSANIQQLQSVDSQNQSDASQLSAAQNDAGTNFSTQENETQP